MLLRDFSLDNELCLRDRHKDAAFFLSSPSVAVAGKHRKRHALRARRHQVISDWSIPHSLGTMSAIGYIENLARNSTRLITYQEITRSI